MVKHLLKEKAPRVGRRLIEALGVNGQFPLRPLPSRGEMPFSATYDGRRPFAHKIAYEGQRRPRLNATCGARRTVDGAAYPPDGLIYVTPAPYCPVPGMSDNDPSRPSSTKAHKVRPLSGHIDQKTAPFDLCVNLPLGARCWQRRNWSNVDRKSKSRTTGYAATAVIYNDIIIM